MSEIQIIYIISGISGQILHYDPMTGKYGVFFLVTNGVY